VRDAPQEHALVLQLAAPLQRRLCQQDYTQSIRNHTSARGNHSFNEKLHA
jgi:hypothetical protein